jgi:hypothetical protein
VTTLLTANFNDLLPAAPPGKVNVKWQADPGTANPRNVSAYVNPAGSGGAATTYKEIAVTAPSLGNFTVAHGFGGTPKFALIQMTSSGEIWLQSPLSFDGTNLYLTASVAGVTAIVTVFGSAADAELALAPAAAGNFTIPHGLGATPSLALIEMLSSGAIWFQSPTPWDATNLYLVASDPTVVGKAEVWQNPPVLNASQFAKVSLSPGAPGNFTVAHGLGAVPALVIVRMSSGGKIWLQSPTGYDASNLYLTASEAGITGEAECWRGSGLPTPIEIALAPGAPGNFSVAHGLGATPKLVLVQMTSGGAIWFQPATRYDATNLYLVASDGGLTGYAEIWT